MALKQVQTTCPYCGAGCQIMFTVDSDANKIVEAVPAKGRTNDGTLCLKGHYGWDYLNDPQILTKRLRKPMIRKGERKRLFRRYPGRRPFLMWQNVLERSRRNTARIPLWEQAPPEARATRPIT